MNEQDIINAAISYAAEQVKNLDADRVTVKCRLSRAIGALRLAHSLTKSPILSEAIKRIDAKWPPKSDGRPAFVGYPDDYDYDDDF